MEYFTTEQGVLFYSYALEAKQTSKLDQFLRLLEDSGVSEVIRKESKDLVNGRPPHDPARMFATILYGFAMGSPTLRQLEESCLYDLRFIHLMEGKTASYVSFCNFINKVIKPHSEEIFTLVTDAIRKRFGLEFDDCYIDGTKIEADANRYKFVWKPTKHHLRLSDKVRNLLKVMVLDRGIPSSGFVPAAQVAEKVTEARRILDSLPEEDAGARKAWSKMTDNLSDYLSRLLDYEEMERICGPNRNSYFKTDHDATAMCLKDDYYSGLGSSMHAAYEVQLVVSCGLIASCYASQDRTDIYTLVPAMDMFHRMYGRYPKRLVADSGYGCLVNYRYCCENGIDAFIKYQSWQGERSGRNPAVYELDQDGNLFCLGGRMGVAGEIEGRHHKYEGTVFYTVEDCTGCKFMAYCRRFMNEKEGEFKVFEVNPEFQMFKQEARDRLLSVDGIELRVNRSCQAEGGFGGLKYNMGYDRFRRTGLAQINVEIMLTGLGFNLRKFFRYFEKGWNSKVWHAPEGTKPESFKMPSAKRLENKVKKKRAKSVNEQAKGSHKYKKL